MTTDQMMLYAKDIATFPPAMQALIEAELKAGNEIIAIGANQPAPMCGCCVRLARQVTTRPRADSPGIRFFERCGSSHSGEFYDAERHFFVLEPAKEYVPPDMDAIREELNARERSANADRSRSAYW